MYCALDVLCTTKTHKPPSTRLWCRHQCLHRQQPLERGAAPFRCHVRVAQLLHELGDRVFPSIVLHLMCICLCIYIYMCMYIYIYVCRFTYTCTHICIYIYAYFHVYIYIYIELHEHIFIYMYRYVYIGRNTYVYIYSNHPPFPPRSARTPHQFCFVFFCMESIGTFGMEVRK